VKRRLKITKFPSANTQCFDFDRRPVLKTETNTNVSVIRPENRGPEFENNTFLLGSTERLQLLHLETGDDRVLEIL
jgi:hypothetical protein